MMVPIEHPPLNTPFEQVIQRYPQILEFFLMMSLPEVPLEATISEYIDRIDSAKLDDLGTSKRDLEERLMLFLEQINHLSKHQSISIETLTIQGGTDKHGNPEPLSCTMAKGEVINILGPTGSGKSRLLADIEWLAQGDTPTGRRILVNGNPPLESWRSSLSNKLVAQLTQNMNFVMDRTVEEFLVMHAQCRMVHERDKEGSQEKVRAIIEHTNSLSGEPVFPDTPLTSLSGGQSRALMIADTIFLSASPILLIDEIENAGINRRKAISLLENKGKIVLVATHDPILALMGNRRVILAHGGIRRVIETSAAEKVRLHELEQMDQVLNEYKERLRRGECVS